MKKKLFSFLVICFCIQISAQNVAVSTNTADWWPQLGQNANLPTLDGWYYRANVGSERLAFDGTHAPGTACATTFGSIGAPYTNMTIKFDATMPAPGSGKSTIIILGSNAAWGGLGIVIEYTEFGVRAVKNFDYSAITWLGSGVDYTTALGAGGLIANNEININAAGVISLKFGTYVCPTTYSADVSVLGNTFVMVCPFATGFKFKNVIAKKSGVAKSYFPNYTYAITATANDDTKGIITGAGSFEKTSDVTLTAIPTSGNKFVKWTDGGVDYSTANPLVFEATLAKTLVAVFDVSTAISKTSNTNFSVYPNPTKSDFTIVSDAIGKAYSVKNILGQDITNGIITNINQKIDLSNQKAGAYLVKIQGEASNMVRTILKNE